MQSSIISAIYRYPLKGFSAERLTNVNLVPGQEIPFDRAFAIENGPSGFNPADPAALPKIRFLMLMRNEKIARFNSRFDTESGVLTISRNGEVCVSGSLFDETSVQAIERWIAEKFGEDLRGEPRILFAEDHTFSDVGEKVLHLINLASVRALGEKIGKPLDPMRFRANLVIDGLEPFAELDWPGQQLQAGETILTAVARTQRCAATNVDPLTGNRDLQLPRSLMGFFGHSDFGVYLKVNRGGRIAAGDTISIAQRAAADLPFS